MELDVSICGIELSATRADLNLSFREKHRLLVILGRTARVGHRSFRLPWRAGGDGIRRGEN
jgi:hypothetical protein